MCWHRIYISDFDKFGTKSCFKVFHRRARLSKIKYKLHVVWAFCGLQVCKISLNSQFEA